MESTEEKAGTTRGFPTIYHQLFGLRRLMEKTLSYHNQDIRKINYDITDDRFKLPGAGVRMVRLRVEPYLKKETSEQAAKRLVSAGYGLATPGDLAAFLYDHPQEWDKWSWILAVSEESRWTYCGSAYVVCAYNYDGNRGFTHWALRDPVGLSESAPNGVLVIQGNMR